MNSVCVSLKKTKNKTKQNKNKNKKTKQKQKRLPGVEFSGTWVIMVKITGVQELVPGGGKGAVPL